VSEDTFYDLYPTLEALPAKSLPRKSPSPPNAAKSLKLLSTQLASMLEVGVAKIAQDVAKLEKQYATEPANPGTINARIDLNNSLAEMLKTITQVQTARSRAGEEEDPEDGETRDPEKSIQNLVDGLMNWKK
jgi:hypothetical protein